MHLEEGEEFYSKGIENIPISIQEAFRTPNIHARKDAFVGI